MTLNANGGTDGTITSITVESGKTIPTTTTGLPTRTDYTLTGWNTKADGTGTAFVFGITAVTSDLTIYAQWTAIVPDAPTNLTATADVTSVNLSWTASANATYYEVYRNNVKANATNITSMTYTDQELDETTTYTYAVKACNSAACSPLSETKSATTAGITITATEIPRIGTDKRYHYVAFSITANTTLTDYTFGLLLSTATAPTAAELRSGASFTRTLSSATKNMLVAYPINSNILKNYSTATQTKIKGATADALLLTHGKTYSLYGVRNGSSTVKKIADFSTDAFPSGGASAVVFDGTSSQAKAKGGIDYFEKGFGSGATIFSTKLSDVLSFVPFMLDRDGSNNPTTNSNSVLGTRVYFKGAGKISEHDGATQTIVSGAPINSIIPTTNYDGTNDVTGYFDGIYSLAYPTAAEKGKRTDFVNVMISLPTLNLFTITMSYTVEE